MCNTTQDNKSLYDRQEERIGVKADAFIGYLVKRGLLGDKNIDDEKIRTAKQEKRKMPITTPCCCLKITAP